METSASIVTRLLKHKPIESCESGDLRCTFAAILPPGVMSYEALDPAKIIQTIEILQNRIDQRFPGSGLSKVCAEILKIGEHAQARSEWIARPLYSLRVATVLLILLIVGGLASVVFMLHPDQGRFEWDDLVQTLEAGINDVLLIGAAIFFLTTMERRIKRHRALAAIHELRSVAHIIDMHQLTKDPERLMLPASPNSNSTLAGMTMYELRRYLEYCGEMLSLVGKIATLYVQKFDDDVSLAAASEVEELTTGLSQKIWQKIMILHSFDRQELEARVAAEETQQPLIVSDK